MKNEVLEYIKNNWDKTFVKAKDDVPYPFSSPSFSHFVDFYYWDLYFINKGLLLSGYDDQVRNNLLNMKYFINTLGYIPNSNAGDMKYRTQPPVFPLCVWDLYKYKNDKKVIEEFIDEILKEHEFFQTRRMTSIGLNAYMCDPLTNDEKRIRVHYKYLKDRAHEESDDLNIQYEIGKDIIAVAESGLDFNARFKTNTRLMAASEFAHLDLNCWLYIDEIRIAEMLDILNRKDDAKAIRNTALKRKELMNKYFLDKDEIYKDYHLKDGYHSEVITAVNLYPYAMGISNDQEGCLKIFNQLKLEHGISAAAKRSENEVYYQWDYPVIWGETNYIAFLACLNCGLTKEARYTIEKFKNTVKTQFEKTGCLWEKYDGRDGSIMNVEYNAPPFMGWTASTYQIFATFDVDIPDTFIKIY